MPELAPGYKPTVVGEDKLDANYEMLLNSVPFLGMRIMTDSPELHTQVLQAGELTPEAALQGDLAFCYVTQDKLDLPGAGGEPLRATSNQHPGEIYASTDLRHFYFQGKNKLGTLVSMAYGIRSLDRIQDDALGLHSALILDRATREATLLVGKNCVGKSTIGQALEDDSDERFVMLSDDWSEVDLSSGYIAPVSPIFSPPEQPSVRYVPTFKSYGKPFYRKDLSDLGLLTSVGLSRIIEIRHRADIQDEDFVLRALSHIPMIRQPLDDQLFVGNPAGQELIRGKIAARQHAILEGYSKLSEQYVRLTVVNDHQKNSLRDAVIQVKRIME